MSFDLFVGAFAHGHRAVFPAQVLRDAFGPYIDKTEQRWLVLRFGPDLSDRCDLSVDTAAGEVDGFSIDPLDDSRLFEALFSVLRREGLVLYMPGDCPPLVGTVETIAHLPSEMTESLGHPVVLKHPAEIPEWIGKA